MSDINILGIPIILPHFILLDNLQIGRLACDTCQVFRLIPIIGGARLSTGMASYPFMLQCPAKDKMKYFWILTLTGLFLLASCGAPSISLSNPTATPAPFAGRVRTTTILSEGMDIAVMIA
jgi:hypothetical protein